MTDRSPVEVADLLASLVQQQTALLQVQSESIRLQRLLVEQLLGPSSGTDNKGSASQPEQPVLMKASPTLTAPPPPQPAETMVTRPPATAIGSGPSGNLAVESIYGPPSAPSTEPTTSHTDGSGVGAGENAAYAARYYRGRPAPTVTPVQPQDLEPMRRLHEMPDQSGLILQFGPHKGDTLALVAMTDPDYIRQLVIRAQRPEVRAAAGRLVEALDAAAAHKPRVARAAGRRPERQREATCPTTKRNARAV